MIVIPAIDLYQGRCVRLRQGQFDQISTYDYSPIALAQEYKQQGAQRLHIVDLDGAKSGKIEQLDLIKAMHSPGLGLQVGGGIRSLAAAQTYLQAGMDQLVIGSIAVTNPELVHQITQQLGVDKIILALDVRIEQNSPKLATNGWQTMTENSLWEVVDYYQQRGIRHILCTDIENDGMLQGPNYSLYQEAIMRFPHINWQASGGIRNLADLKQLASLGIAAAILGRMLYESNFEISAYQEENQDAN